VPNAAAGSTVSGDEVVKDAPPHVTLGSVITSNLRNNRVRGLIST
jgi:hypothetical protein